MVGSRHVSRIRGFLPSAVVVARSMPGAKAKGIAAAATTFPGHPVGVPSPSRSRQVRSTGDIPRPDLPHRVVPDPDTCWSRCSREQGAVLCET